MVPAAMVPPGGLEPPPHGLRARRAALTPRRGRSGANDRIRTDTSRLGRPAGSRYPTFALVRPNGPVLFTGLSTSFSCQRLPLISSGLVAARNQPQASRPYCPCWRQCQDSNPDPRDLEARMLPLHHTVDLKLDSSVDAVLLSDLAQMPRVLRPKTKKAF